MPEVPSLCIRRYPPLEPLTPRLHAISYRFFTNINKSGSRILRMSGNQAIKF